MAESHPEIWSVDGINYEIARTYFQKRGDEPEYVVEVDCSRSSAKGCGSEETLNTILSAVADRQPYEREVIVGHDLDQLQIKVVISGSGRDEMVTRRPLSELKSIGGRSWGDHGEFRVIHPRWYLDASTDQLYYIVDWTAEPSVCREVVKGELPPVRAQELAEPLMNYIVRRRLHVVPKDDSGLPSSYKMHNTSRIGIAISCEQPGSTPIVYRISRSIDDLEPEVGRDR